jgi:16S rRNA (guanine(527)-N(7))-methyltransferase GidB
LPKTEIEMSHSDKIELFKEETIKFNRKHNLISRKNTEKIIDEAIEEAITLTKHLKQHKNILDIGTGSGLPGIPLAILNENKNVYLSEKNNKKNYHLKKTIKLLEIENATTIGSANKNTKINKKVDCVVTKAFASTKKTIDVANSFLEKPFTLMLLKGKLKTINKEIAEANISKENYEIIKIENEKEKHILKIQNE